MVRIHFLTSSETTENFLYSKPSIEIDLRKCLFRRFCNIMKLRRKGLQWFASCVAKKMSNMTCINILYVVLLYIKKRNMFNDTWSCMSAQPVHNTY